LIDFNWVSEEFNRPIEKRGAKFIVNSNKPTQEG